MPIPSRPCKESSFPYLHHPRQPCTRIDPIAQPFPRQHHKSQFSIRTTTPQPCYTTLTISSSRLPFPFIPSIYPQRPAPASPLPEP
ncbi:hypothetical protein K491DRAFT_694938 [Lophiostoma macrostomum CBS 122681]|uniref:Uncharacterized protein n=1 Tax=Lophiostoma macrostomum CBS 122681 TaxID=1314788 RepID=A0A6A6T3W4_9PLEO|nr:hypothetical protein K491DRAFT_694938 [Lophiostoma macrostomum CBS 122681]